MIKGKNKYYRLGSDLVEEFAGRERRRSCVRRMGRKISAGLWEKRETNTERKLKNVLLTKFEYAVKNKAIRDRY